MKITAIAIDDEPPALMAVEKLGSMVSFLEIKKTFTSAIEAIPFLQNNKIDLIFLDIEMPDINGLDLLKMLDRIPMIIIITAFPKKYSIQAYEIGVIDFLPKPFSLVRFTQSCARALEQKILRNTDSDKFIFIKVGYDEQKIFLKDILYLEADSIHIIYVLSDGRKLRCRQTFSDAMEFLPETHFARIHRSFLIAIDKIEIINRQGVAIAGTVIPVGANYDDKLAEIRNKLTRQGKERT